LDLSRFTNKNALVTRGNFITMLYNTRRPISDWLMNRFTQTESLNGMFERIEKALTWYPDNVDAYSSLCGMYIAFGEYEDALKLTEMIIRIDPMDFTIYQAR
jgi:tetratricopeptide (TPR) repeat protein